MSRGLVVCVVSALAALYVACAALNRDQPLVRNGLVYARASERVIEHGFDPRPVVADSKLSYDKPVGFAWLASPLVAKFGTHRGLMVASCVGTLAYLLALFAFALGFELTELERAALILFAGLGPLVAYQSWSAHPDSLFAALYLACVAMSRRLVERPSLFAIAGLCVAWIAALLLKNYALILLPSCALFFVWNRKQLFARASRAQIATLASAFAIAATFAALAKLGLNPWLRIQGEGGGAAQYGRGELWISAKGTALQVALTLALQLQVAAPWIVQARGWRRARGSPALLALCISFRLPYVAGLMPFPTTFYNARYFVPLLPFAALLAVLGLRVASERMRRAVLVTFTLIALATTAAFNDAQIYSALRPRIPRLEVDWIGVPLSFLDNLRMPMHVDQAASLAHLNANVEPGAVVYMLDANYYGDAQRGVFERAGLIRGDIETRYVSSRDFAPEETRFYLFGRLRDSARIEALGRVTDLGRELRLVERE